MKEAIKKAIEGGWKEGRFTPKETLEFGLTYTQSALLDPEFWQALGKAMGWEQEIENEFGEKEIRGSKNWKIKWHRFIDHLAEGKDADSFFKELLTPLS